MRRKLVLIVIDGLTPSMLESAVEARRTPALALLTEQGDYGRAVSTFPSLTPVCLSSIATGAHPDVHHIPHLVWWHRGERRIVEYGSSAAALRAAGTMRSIRDTIFKMNQEHLGPGAVTVFESLEDSGLTAAAINITCYRGRTRHMPKVRGWTRAAYGPKRFFYFNLFESDATGAPLAIRNRAAGSVDGYAAAVGRWLVTRDGFDFLAFYLPDYDFASHLAGPDAAHDALARSDRAVGALMDAAGGADEFLERYAVVLCSDHGQTKVERTARLDEAFSRDGGLVVTASNRAGQVYRLGEATATVAELAARLDGAAAAEVALYLEDDGSAVARRDGEQIVFARTQAGWETSGDRSILDHPQGLERAWAALHNPQAGDLLVSAAPGWDFTDLGGRHHVGGGSHGSLTGGDSLVPVLTVGLEQPGSITEIAPLVLRHFDVRPPPYVAELARAA